MKTISFLLGLLVICSLAFLVWEVINLAEYARNKRDYDRMVRREPE